VTIHVSREQVRILKEEVVLSFKVIYSGIGPEKGEKSHDKPQSGRQIIDRE
jgi:hypothetical protein